MPEYGQPPLSARRGTITTIHPRYQNLQGMTSSKPKDDEILSEKLTQLTTTMPYGATSFQAYNSVQALLNPIVRFPYKSDDISTPNDEQWEMLQECHLDRLHESREFPWSPRHNAGLHSSTHNKGNDPCLSFEEEFGGAAFRHLYTVNHMRAHPPLDPEDLTARLCSLDTESKHHVLKAEVIQKGHTYNYAGIVRGMNLDPGATPYQNESPPVLLSSTSTVIATPYPLELQELFHSLTAQAYISNGNRCISKHEEETLLDLAWAQFHQAQEASDEFVHREHAESSSLTSPEVLATFMETQIKSNTKKRRQSCMRDASESIGVSKTGQSEARIALSQAPTNNVVRKTRGGRIMKIFTKRPTNYPR